MSADVPPLTLPRIQRLIRPLRSSLAAFLASVTAADRLALQSAQQRDSTKGNGKRKSYDGDYTDRLKRSGARVGATTKDSSSPFQSTAAKRRHHSKSTTYGSRGKLVNPVQVNNRRESGGLSSTQTPQEQLAATGFATDVITKALLLRRSYRNVLEAVYGPEKQQECHGVKPSLVEIMAKELGWMIEDSVRDEDDNDAPPMMAIPGRNDKDTSSEDDKTILVEEWYDTVPAYCRRWMLAQHATSIVIEGLEGQAFVLMEILLRDCVLFNARAEAARFYAPLLQSGLANPLKSRSSFLSLATLVAPLQQPTQLFSALETTLLESSFEERYFYSDFVDISRTRFCLDDAPGIARLLATLARVGGEMLESIASVDDAEEDEAEEIARLSEEVTYRLERQLESALFILLDARPSAVEDLASILFAIVEAFPAPSNDLAPLSAILEISLLTEGPYSPAPELHLSRLSHLHSIFHTSIFTQLAALLPHLSSQDFVSLSNLFHSSSLFGLEAPVLAFAFENYDNLPDVWPAVLPREVFATRLQQAKGHLGEAEDDKNKAATVVAETPKPVRRPSGAPNSPLALSSLGRRSYRVPKQAHHPRRWRRLCFVKKPNSEVEAEDYSCGDNFSEDAEPRNEEDAFATAPSSPAFPSVPKRKIDVVDVSLETDNDDGHEADELDLLSQRPVKAAAKKKRRVPRSRTKESWTLMSDDELTLK